MDLNRHVHKDNQQPYLPEFGDKRVRKLVLGKFEV